MTRTITGSIDDADIRHFQDTFLYTDEGILVDRINSLDAEQNLIEAELDTTRPLPSSAHQRVSDLHPAHVAAGDLLMVTGTLGFMHAWFFHGCRWDQGWSGFGTNIHRADFRGLAQIGPPLSLESRETRSRVGSSRVVLRYTFRFTQADRVIYVGDQTAMFFKNRSLG